MEHLRMTALCGSSFPLPTVADDPSRSLAAEIATLSGEQIERMSNEHIVSAIRAVRASHLREDVAENLPYMDRPTLERLLYLTRRYCRNTLPTAACEPS
jgi:hypothetical protein